MWKQIGSYGQYIETYQSYEHRDPTMVGSIMIMIGVGTTIATFLLTDDFAAILVVAVFSIALMLLGLWVIFGKYVMIFDRQKNCLTITYRLGERNLHSTVFDWTLFNKLAIIEEADSEDTHYVLYAIGDTTKKLISSHLMYKSAEEQARLIAKKIDFEVDIQVEKKNRK